MSDFDSSFFDDINDIDVSAILPECNYHVIVTLYNESVVPVKWYRDMFVLSEFNRNNFISSCKDKIINGLFKLGSLSQEYFSFVAKQPLVFQRNVLLYKTRFCAIKTKQEYSLLIHVNKVQNKNCILRIPGNSFARIELH